jgi:hypothetical protein
MSCAKCGRMVVDHAPGLHGHPYEDSDRDIDVKLDGPRLERRPRELCTLCGIRDGRALPDSWRGRPICKQCGETVQTIIDLFRLRTVDVAAHAIIDTGRSICEAMHKLEDA